MTLIENIYGLNAHLFDNLKNLKPIHEADGFNSENFNFLSENADDLVYQFYWEAHFEDVDMKSN